MSKFSNLKIKWPKSVEKLENGGRLGPLRQDLPPPPPPNGPLDPPLLTTPQEPESGTIAVAHSNLTEHGDHI